MPKLHIKATKFSKTPESDEVFNQVGWTLVYDQTTIPEKRKTVDKGKHSTPLIGLEWEELEYD